MPRKSKKEEGKELDERIAQLKLLVAEKKKKEQSKAVASNIKEEILGKKKAKAQEQQQELELRQEKLMKEREDQVLKKKIYKLIREKYLSHKGPYITYSPPPGPMTTFGSILVEIDDYLMETQGRGIQTFFTKPQLLDIGKSFNRERMKKERIQRMNKARDDKAKEDYIKNNQVLKKYGIKNLKDAEFEVRFWGDILGKIDNKEMFDLRPRADDEGRRTGRFSGNEYQDRPYPKHPTKEQEDNYIEKKKKYFMENRDYPERLGMLPFLLSDIEKNRNKLVSDIYTMVNEFTRAFNDNWIKRELGKTLTDYPFQKTLPTREEIANLIDSVNTVIDRYSTITSKKKITRADYTSDEYDTESTVASDYFSEDSDSDFEGRLDREDKPLKQGRLTVVEDKPKVLIDDKSFIF